MAKKRLLAALLAVVLIVSAFPLILNVTASDVTPLSGEKFTGDGTVSLVDDVLGEADSNTYVRIYDVENYNATFPQFANTAATVEAGAYYELHFFARTNSIVNDPGSRNYYLGRVYYGATTTPELYPSNTAIFSGNTSGSYIAVDDEWQEFTIVFQVPASTPYTNPTITFRGSQVIAGYVPLEIDEMTLIKVDADTLDTTNKTYSTTGSYLLDCTSESSEDWTGEWSIAGTAARAEIATVTETEYYRASAPASGNTSVSYSDVTLDAGYYELSGDFRLSQIDGSKITVTSHYVTSDTNAAGLTLTAAGVSADSTLSNEWGSSTVEFLLAEKTTLSDITLALDSALAFDYKNIVITKTADYEAPEIEVPTTHDGWTGMINVIDDVLDTDAGTVGEADTNSYVHVYNADGDSSIIYRENYTATNPTPDLFRGNTYQLSVWLRTSPLDCDGTVTGDACYKDIEVRLGTKGNTCISQPMANPNGSSLVEGTNIRKYVYGEFVSLEGPKSTEGALRVLPEWNKYTMTFEVTETCNELSLDTLFPIIFLSKSGAEDKIPFDLDGLSLKEVELNAETGKYNVVGDELIDPKMGTNSNVHWYTHSSQAIGVGAGVTYITETEYNRVNANDGDTVTSMEYTGTDVLTMGVYTLTGKFRLSAIDRADFVADTRVWTSDTLTLSLDSDAIIYEGGINTATIGVDSFTDVTYTFTLTEETSLEGLTLAISDTASFDYKDLEITKIKDINAKWSANGVPASAVNDVLGGTDTNEYIHVYDRISELDLVQYSDADVNLTAGAAYTMSVYMREGSIIEDRAADTTAVQIYYSAPTTDRLVTSDTVTDALVGDFHADLDAALVGDGWTKYTMTFTPIENQTGLKVIFKILGNADFATTFDIDGLSLVSSDGTELITDGEWETVAYAEDTGVEVITLTESAYNRGVNETEDNTVLTYFGNNHAAGTYTVSGKVRLASRSTALVEYTLKQYRPDLWLSLVTDDNNEATLSVYAGDALGDSAVITDEWSEITLTVSADSAFEALTLALDCAYDLDFDDLTVTKAN